MITIFPFPFSAEPQCTFLIAIGVGSQAAVTTVFVPYKFDTKPAVHPAWCDVRYLRLRFHKKFFSVNLHYFY